jgi:hypothetical protein
MFFDAAANADEAEKQNQSGILAQKIFVTQKTSGWNFFVMFIHLLNPSRCQVPRL